MPAGLIIRPATHDDAADIVDIVNPVITQTTVTFTTTLKTPQSVTAAISEGAGAYLVAEVAGQVVGFATYFPFRNGPGYARTKEHSIVLGSAARGQGTGRALMAALCDHARAQGVHSMWAGVSAENRAGVEFHAAIGFGEIAVLPEVGHKFGRYIDLVLMCKRL